MGTYHGWLIIPEFRRDDVVAPHRMSAPMIRDLTLEATHANLLAMVFFVVRHADAEARARCTFYQFDPKTDETSPVLSKGR